MRHGRIAPSSSREVGQHARTSARDQAPADRPQSPVHDRDSLGLRSQARLDSFIAQVSDRKSPNYGHYLTPAQFAADYAPTPTGSAGGRPFARPRPDSRRSLDRPEECHS